MLARRSLHSGSILTLAFPVGCGFFRQTKKLKSPRISDLQPLFQKTGVWRGQNCGPTESATCSFFFRRHQQQTPSRWLCSQFSAFRRGGQRKLSLLESVFTKLLPLRCLESAF